MTSDDGGRRDIKGSPAQLRRVAYHEAGHAVIAWHERVRINVVSIEANDENWGRVHLGWFRKGTWIDAGDRRVERRLESGIYIANAGVIAERRVSGRHNWIGAEHDLGNAADLVLRLVGPDPKVTTPYVKYMWARTQNWVDVNWSDIEAVADELLLRRKMTGREVREFLMADLNAKVDRRMADLVRA